MISKEAIQDILDRDSPTDEMFRVVVHEHVDCIENVSKISCAKRWCNENILLSALEYRAWHHVYDGTDDNGVEVFTFYFDNEVDATAFKLVWG